MYFRDTYTYQSIWICRGGFMLANIDFTSIVNEPTLPTSKISSGFSMVSPFNVTKVTVLLLFFDR